MGIPREAHAIDTNSSAIRAMRDSLALTDYQQQLLIGLLLGDGALVPNSWMKHYRLFIGHGEEQKAYLFWLYKAFQSFTLSAPKYHTLTKSWRFRTISHPAFTAFHDSFYPQGSKAVPESIRDLLVSPLSLAIWYMDDGCYVKRNRTFVLNTQSFSKIDNERLQMCLLENFGITANLNRDKRYWRLYIPMRSA